MRGAVLFVAIFALALLVIPMIGLNFETELAQPLPVQGYTPPLQQAPNETEPPEEQADQGAYPTREEAAPPPDMPPNNHSTYGVTEFKILDAATGKVNTVPLRDYLRGAVAAEMPASFHTEALKAQAVAAHTYALYNHLLQQESPEPTLKGADFSANPSGMEGYITEKTARAFYGEGADLYWSKICEAADSVVGYILEYEDEPIVAAYHAISAGQTEDAANVWSGGAPYLVAADSPGDYLAPDYETTVTIPVDQVRRKLLAAYPGADLSDDPQAWFGEMQRSNSGYITSIEVGGQAVHGKEIRQIFDLRSHNLEIAYHGDVFAFTTCGYGHGVGLSQYGADFMARQGAGFGEILANYYPGTTLKQVRFEG